MVKLNGMAVRQAWLHLKLWWARCPLWAEDPHIFIRTVNPPGMDDHYTCLLCGAEEAADEQ